MSRHGQSVSRKRSIELSGENPVAPADARKRSTGKRVVAPNDETALPVAGWWPIGRDFVVKGLGGIATRRFYLRNDDGGHQDVLLGCESQESYLDGGGNRVFMCRICGKAIKYESPSSVALHLEGHSAVLVVRYYDNLGAEVVARTKSAPWTAEHDAVATAAIEWLRCDPSIDAVDKLLNAPLEVLINGCLEVLRTRNVAPLSEGNGEAEVPEAQVPALVMDLMQMKASNNFSSAPQWGALCSAAHEEIQKIRRRATEFRALFDDVEKLLDYVDETYHAPILPESHILAAPGTPRTLAEFKERNHNVHKRPLPRYDDWLWSWADWCLELRCIFDHNFQETIWATWLSLGRVAFTLPKIWEQYKKKTAELFLFWCRAMRMGARKLDKKSILEDEQHLENLDVRKQLCLVQGFMQELPRDLPFSMDGIDEIHSLRVVTPRTQWLKNLDAAGDPDFNLAIMEHYIARKPRTCGRCELVRDEELQSLVDFERG
ncbi:hypothetical protein DFJ74DRAFT_686801 [Hyaloraphidium curvatum]|nr:hypothetical protein DFJ74DRAFT_686801 [Hyaloraphidium curvatum]